MGYNWFCELENRMKTFFRELLITAMLALIIFFAVQTSLQTFVVIGPSMQPNLEDEQRLMVNRVVYRLHPPERGDVVVFHSPNNHQEDYIKRIIALPEDTVEIKNGAVYVNGSKLDEPYIKSQPGYVLAEQTITEDSYFVLGDNRNNSNDSHRGWVVPRENIVGKAWLSIWPINKWEIVADYPLQEQLASAKSK